MVLEVATAAGSLLGGITAQHMNQHVLEQIFALVTTVAGITTLTRINRRNVILATTSTAVYSVDATSSTRAVAW